VSPVDHEVTTGGAELVKLLVDADVDEAIVSVATDDATIDWWPINTKRAQWGRDLPTPTLVVRPRDPDELAAVLAALAELGVAVVPRGLASSVVGGAAASRGAVTVETRAMTRVIDVDDVSLTVTVEAGVRGSVLEEFLNERGLTSGHYPQSLALSTVGGWVATRASGTFSAKYGNIEDLVLGLEWVAPDGSRCAVKAVPRRSTGPDLRALMLGSEGMFGIVSTVTLQVRRLPTVRRFACYTFADVRAALTAVRQLFQLDVAPAVVRLYDHSDHRRFDLPGDVGNDEPALFLAWDGHGGVVDAMIAAADEVLVACHARSHGAAPAERWFATRFDVSALERAILAPSTFGDTCEIAFPWRTVAAAYDDVMDVFRSRGVAASGHFSHVYHSGTSLYIVFVGGPANEAELEALHQSLWDGVMGATLRHDGTIAHHHGIGRIRTPWVRAEYGSSWPMFEAVRRAIDPGGRFNPELFRDAPAD